MAKTVGLPIGIVTKLLLEDKIQQRGVCIPIGKEFYEPVLKELNTLGISFKEQLS
jgi:saccharopine dehydrogenase (NADP+, L-glutamate forming)